MMQQAIRQDLADHLLASTYKLEAEGDIIMRSYEIHSATANGVHSQSRPNAQGLARKFATETPLGLSGQLDTVTLNHWNIYYRACAEPCIRHWDRLFSPFNGELKHQIQVLEVCTFFDPVAANQMDINITHVNKMMVLPLVTNTPGMLEALKAELPAYQAKVAPINKVNDIFIWWDNVYTAEEIPAWVEVARYVLVLRSHAAGPERIFSRVRQTFGDTQHGCLEDQIEASIMSQVNTEEF